MASGISSRTQVDFAQSTVWIEIGWTKGNDHGPHHGTMGPGFPAHVPGASGDPPFVTGTPRPPAISCSGRGYSGMGLGLFIGETLLERSGADVTFANARGPFQELSRPGQPHGAVVECVWGRRSDPGIEARPDRRPLGQNATIKV